MLDLNNFIKLAPLPSDSLFYIKVTDINHIMLSPRLMDKIPFRSLDIYCANDGRIIAVKSSADGSLKANVNGYIRTDVISELMKRHGIKTPARFVAEWIEADKIWLCTYCGDYYKQRNIENTPMPKTVKKKNYTAMAV